MSNKRFAGNLLFVQALNFIIKPVWIFLIDREVQNLLGETIYGNYFVHFNLSLLFIILLDAGIQTFNTKEVAASSEFMRKHMAHFFILKLLLSISYMVLLLVVGFNNKMNLSWLAILGLNQVLVSFVQYFRSNLAGLQHFKADSILSVLDKAIAAILCVFLLWSDNHREHFTIREFVTVQNIGLSFTFLVSLLLNLKELRFYVPFIPKYKDTLLLLKNSLPYALLAALMSVFTRIDAIMIHNLASYPLFEAGLYVQSFRLLDAVSMFAVLVSGLLLPMFSRHISQKSDLRPLVFLASKLLLIPAIVGVCFVFFYGDTVLGWLYKFGSVTRLEYSVQIFKVLMASFIPLSMMYVFGTLLTAKGAIGLLNKIAILCVVANIALNYLLIPKENAYGAAFATLLTQSMFSFFCFVFAYKQFGLVFQKIFTLKIFLFIILLIAVGFATPLLKQQVIVNIVIFLSCSFATILALNFFPLKRLRDLFGKHTP